MGAWMPGLAAARARSTVGMPPLRSKTQQAALVMDNSGAALRHVKRCTSKHRAPCWAPHPSPSPSPFRPSTQLQAEALKGAHYTDQAHSRLLFSPFPPSLCGSPTNPRACTFPSSSELTVIKQPEHDRRPPPPRVEPLQPPAPAPAHRAAN
eukprot:363421-Chlamydomonas_euryale.AAC.7